MLIGILVILAIIVLVLTFLTMRRINIVFKKLDYLTEDLTYKTESLSSVVEVLKSFSKYITLIQGLIDDSDDEIHKKHIKENRKKILALANYLKKVASEKEYE